MKNIVISITWALLAFYLAIVGWNAANVYKESQFDGKSYDYGEINFKTRGDVEEYKRQLRVQEGDYGGLLLTWLPRSYTPFCVPLIFGLLGGAFGSVITEWRHAFDVPTRTAILHPLIGLIVGVLFYAMSMVVPKLLVAQETTPSWSTLIWFSFIGGVFAEQALNFAKGIANKLFGPPPRRTHAASTISAPEND